MFLPARLILEPIGPDNPYYAVLRTPLCDVPLSIRYVPDITRIATEVARTHGFIIS